MKNIKQIISSIIPKNSKNLSGIYNILKVKFLSKIQSRFLLSQEGQNNSPKTKNYKLKTNFGFTLVELIVVITILAILGTIAFVSFKNYSSGTRDSGRVSDLANISKGLELFQLKTGSYPMPEGTILTGTINGIDVVYKGVIGDNISRMISFSKTPTDYLDNTTHYIYGITYDKTKYQVASTSESSTAYNSKIYNIITTPVFADGELAQVKGNYNQIIKFSTGSTTKYWYIANVPSLIFNFSGTVLSSGVDILTNKTNTYFVVNKNTNLPYPVGNIKKINNKTSDTIVQELTNTGTTYFTGVDITSIVNATTNTERDTAIQTIFGTGANASSSALISSFGVNSSSLSSTAITSQLVSVVGGSISSVNSSNTPLTQTEPILSDWGDSTNTTMNYLLAARLDSDFTCIGTCPSTTGIVQDNITGLMWQSVPLSTTYTWDNAKAYCAGLSLGGYNDWRMPDINELASIVDYSFSSSNYWYETKFTIEANNYWFCTTFAGATTMARYLDFNNANQGGDYKYNSYRVICTR